MLLDYKRRCSWYLRNITTVCCEWHLVLTLQQLSAGEEDLLALADPRGSESKCWCSSQPNCWQPVLCVMWMDSLSQLFSSLSPPPLLWGRWKWVCPRRMLLHCLFYVYLGKEQGSSLFCVWGYNRRVVISWMSSVIVSFFCLRWGSGAPDKETCAGGSSAGGSPDLHVAHRAIAVLSINSVCWGVLQMTCTTQTCCVEWSTTFIAQMAPHFIFTVTLTMLGKVVSCQLGSTSHCRMARFIHRLGSLLHSSCWEALSPCQPSDAITSQTIVWQTEARNAFAANTESQLVECIGCCHQCGQLRIGHTSHGHGVGRLKSPIV